MNIGILTYHSVYNFGAYLQTLSTVEYFKKAGYNPIIINWIPKGLEEYYKNHTPESQAIIHQEFITKYLPVSELCRTDDDIVNVINKNEIQGIIVGSDSVVKHVPFLARIDFPTKKIVSLTKPTTDRVFPNPYWGSFLSKLNRDISIVMMSVSSQNADYRKILFYERKKILHSLNQFKYISVRDTWTQRMMSYLTYGEATFEITPDPVFAFNQNAGDLVPSQEEIAKKFLLPKKYILISFNNYPKIKKEWIKEFKRLANQKDIITVGLPMPQGSNDLGLDLNIQLPLSPLDWYSLIKYSSGYVGHNMHPIIVAIHNNVPFFSFDYYGILRLRLFIKKESSKVYDLLSRIAFEDYIHNMRGIQKRKINPETVLHKLLTFREKECEMIRKDKFNQYTNMMTSIESHLRQNHHK